MDLFSSQEQVEKIIIPLEDATIVYYPSFLSTQKADILFQKLYKQTPWQQDDIKVFGKIYTQPRLTCLYGETGKSYGYSGIRMQPHPFTSQLSTLRDTIEEISEEKFTTVLLNLYRNGADSNGWHSDNEKELGSRPAIASVSLGAKRCFHLKHKRDKNLKHKIFLNHGSLLLMTGETQHNWLHQLPKSKKVTDARINLTFRKII